MSLGMQVSLQEQALSAQIVRLRSIRAKRWNAAAEERSARLAEMDDPSWPQTVRLRRALAEWARTRLHSKLDAVAKARVHLENCLTAQDEYETGRARSHSLERAQARVLAAASTPPAGSPRTPRRRPASAGPRMVRSLPWQVLCFPAACCVGVLAQGTIASWMCVIPGALC